MTKEPLRVILIDDDEDYFVIVRDLLAEVAGFEIDLTWLDTYDKGLAALGRTDADVFFVDYRLGARNGVELLWEAAARLVRTPLILLTGQGDQEIAVEAMKAGAADYLVKGQVDPPSLERAIRHAIEHKRVEAELHDSEERFRQLAENIDEVFWMCNATQSEILYFSPAFENIWGISRAEAYAKPRLWHDCIHPDDRARVDRVFRELDRRPATVEYRICRPDGETRWVRNRGFAVHDSAGAAIRHTGVAEDITESKLADETLRRTTEQLQAVFWAFPDLFFLLDRDGTVLDYRGGHQEELYRPPEEFLGRRMPDVLPADLGRRLQDALARLRRDRQLVVMEYSLPLPGGEQFFEARLVPLADERIVVLARNITGRKEVEETNARLIAAIEQSADMIIVTDLRGTIQYVNPAFERVSGYTAREAIGENPRMMKSGNQEDGYYRSLWTTITSGNVWAGRLINKKKDGSLFEIESTISPVRDNAGAIINFVAVGRDITYQRQIEDQLRQVQKMDAIGRLAGGVAHDFNNMLTVINSYCALLGRRLRTHDGLGRKELDEIEKAAERAGTLTRQLLAFSRKQVLQPQEVDLNQVVTGMERMLRRLIGEDIVLNTVLDPNLGHIRADPGQLEQVIMNLAVNARDAMPRGGQLTIETAVYTITHKFEARTGEVQPGNYVRLVINDTGSGMTDDVRAHLFEPFFTTKDVGKGTGLGLATCYGIVKQSGGHILVYSELAVGSTVKIYLPTVGASAIDTSGAAGELPPVTPGQETILLVEDEPALRMVGALVLREAGYTVLEAANGVEALRIAQDHRDRWIDMVVSDVIMPEMDGPQLVRQLKVLYPDTKILFVSGYTNDALATRGVLDPDIAFLEKPFTPSRLTHKVREVLDLPNRPGLDAAAETVATA